MSSLSVLSNVFSCQCETVAFLDQKPSPRRKMDNIRSHPFFILHLIFHTVEIALIFSLSHLVLVQQSTFCFYPYHYVNI